MHFQKQCFFSGMKRVVSASRSRMLQARKEHLVMLQVEHGLLRWLSKQPNFYENIVKRFKENNQRYGGRGLP